MMFASEYRDCEFPIDEEQKLNDDGEIEPSCRFSFYSTHAHLFLTLSRTDWAWKYKFSRDIIYEVDSVICSVGPVKHARVLELDQEIRSFQVPSHLQIPPDGLNWERDGNMTTMQRFMVAMNCNASKIHFSRKP